MRNNIVKHNFSTAVEVENIITIFYMEMSKDFGYEGERHDFWEMVYIDKGEMLCTADKSQFVLKSGELTFHKPNEFHNLSGNKSVVPNVSIITFECYSPMMEYFEGKIFRLNAEERLLLSMLFQEGLSCFKLEDPENPLLQRVERVENAPFGSQQMTKNLLEIFLIKLHRHKEAMPKENRLNVRVNGIAVPMDVKEILDVLESHIYDRLTVGEIARILGKSESAVKERFALYQAGGIIHYYNSLKIKEAKRLIREGSYNLAQIADMLRFDTPQYFSKCFKDYTHMTPSEYKRSILRI
ncbi:MAG: helix-turn-helix transcriptional regulator [Clostridia bacterium]|nr:helix-turn-helix transcriptional regulator [Clostridia bacterium]